MFSFPIANEMLYFDIPAAQVNDIAAWILLADEAWLGYQIETQGSALVIRYYGQRGFQRLTELPQEAGVAEPFYGTTGGAYHFIFTIQQNKTALRVEHVNAGQFNLKPYEVVLNSLPKFETHAKPSAYWNSNSLDGLIHNRKYNYSMFIDGEMYVNMLAAGWQKETAHVYSYEFIPTTVGCRIIIYNLLNAQSTDLTGAIDP